MRFGVLTRRNTWFGRELLERLRRRGLQPDCIGVERVTWSARWKMARFLARKTGLANAAYHNARIWSRLALASLAGERADFDYNSYCPNVLVVKNVNGPEMEQYIAGRRLDLVVLGQSGVIRENLLRLPRIGTLNCHPGPLPDFRGVDVVKWTCWARCHPRATLHYVDRGIDTGDVIQSVPVQVLPTDGIAELERRVIDRSLDVLVDAVAQAAGGRDLPRVPQPRGLGRQYFLMPPWVERRLRRDWPEIRRFLLSRENVW